MFSSKSKRGKWAWAFVDLLVVIIGVYCAFLIQSSAQSESARKEKIKVFSALKMELEEFRVAFPQFADGNENMYKEMAAEELSNIIGWRFIEPQYGYQIIEYAINSRDSEIIDFETYEKLRNLLVGIKQLEHTERLITEIAGQYKLLVPELSEDHPINLEIKAENRAKFIRFKMFLRTRIGILRRVSETAQPLLDQVNKTLGDEKKLEIDKLFMVSKMGWIDDEEEAVGLAKQHFPDVPEEEVRALFRSNKDSGEASQ